MVVLVGVVSRCARCAELGPQGVGAEGAAGCIAVALDDLAVGISFCDQAFCAVEVVGALVVGSLAQSASERVITVGGDDGITCIVYFDSYKSRIFLIFIAVESKQHGCTPREESTYL